MTSRTSTSLKFQVSKLILIQNYQVYLHYIVMMIVKTFRKEYVNKGMFPTPPLQSTKKNSVRSRKNRSMVSKFEAKEMRCKGIDIRASNGLS